MMEMTQQDYDREIEFIFNRFPSYQKVGGTAYKPGIGTMRNLDDLMGHPHRKFRSIHIAGTNGKGSVSHMLAAALMETPPEFAGLLRNVYPLETPSRREKECLPLKVGLYTSPHLLDFRERIRIDGEMIGKEFVYDFILKYKEAFLRYEASFFEITTAMAFAYFAQQGVDFAVVECGLGGRLDSTNIILPAVSVITNIGLDHCEYLGHTLPEIAREKAGIIKPGVPVVIGESESSSVKKVFLEKAREMNSPIYFASLLGEEAGKEDRTASGSSGVGEGPDRADSSDEDIYWRARELHGLIKRDEMDLRGACQEKNIKTVSLAYAVSVLGRLPETGEMKSGGEDAGLLMRAAVGGIVRAAARTGLRGRWETLCERPRIICDTGHNAHGFRLLGPQIVEEAAKYGRLIMIFGVVADKDLDSIVGFLPNEYLNRDGERLKACYYFVNASGRRALPAEVLASRLRNYGFTGRAVCRKPESTGEDSGEGREAGPGSVGKALEMYMKEQRAEDLVFIGGSTFVVAEAMEFFEKK